MAGEGVYPKASGDEWFASEATKVHHSNYLTGQTINAGVSVGDAVYFDGTNWKEAISGIRPQGIYESATNTVVVLSGVCTLSGLTAGLSYYANTSTGAVTSTPTPWRLGKAISTTELLLDIQPIGEINATAVKSNQAQFSTTSTSYVDVTNFTVDISPTVQSTIIAHFSGNFFGDSGNGTGTVALLINGSIVCEQTAKSVTNANNPMGVSLVGRTTGLAAGTYTVKIQMLGDGSTIYLTAKNQLVVMAIGEV